MEAVTAENKGREDVSGNKVGKKKRRSEREE